MSTATDATTAAPGRRERKKIQTRSAIIQSAWMLFQQKGVTSTSIRDIAELADVSDTTVLNYFANKDELVEATVDVQHQGVRQVTQLLLDRPAAESPATALRRGLASLGEEMDDADARRQLRLWRTTADDIDLYGAYLRLHARLAHELAEALRERATMHGQEQVSVEALIRAALASIDAVARQQPDRPSAREWMRQIDDVLARLERGWKQ